jgi:hypothetical protein
MSALVWNYDMDAAPHDENYRLVKTQLGTRFARREGRMDWVTDGGKYLRPIAWCALPEIAEPPKPRRWTITVEAVGGEVEWGAYRGEMFYCNGDIYAESDSGSCNITGEKGYDYDDDPSMIQPLRVVSVEEVE